MSQKQPSLETRETEKQFGQHKVAGIANEHKTFSKPVCNIYPVEFHVRPPLLVRLVLARWWLNFGLGETF